ncbi:conserved hypothetical protein [Pediculus humanus corporis]|uniref:Ionotropic glutamate receptor L-glutamate and glycine-binding domain-containing protein n=1 Tax=Pediculus humanus subsp. corporis TaxID=121224 RepID=E0VQQ0_PEDHC|nr:uncharacterized protein Phum_PHUM380920 [Pediculus humanus corporis]EEB15706.1 conserved hypothetical protein [Pediculus humanus corporis]
MTDFRYGLNNFYGCLLNSTVVNLPPIIIFPKNEEEINGGAFNPTGTEASIVLELSKKLNFKSWFAIPEDKELWGWIYPSPGGVIGDIFTKKSYFGIGLLAATTERHHLLDISVPTEPKLECLSFAVPFGVMKKQADWIEIYINEFKINVWINYEKKSISSVALDTFSAFLGFPINVTQNSSFRIITIAWIWYSFIIIISYQSLMRSKLTVPYHPKEIDTIPELLESDLDLYGPINLVKFVANNAEGIREQLVNRFELKEFIVEEVMNYVSFHKDKAYLQQMTSLFYYAMINPNSRGKVHFMKECASEYYPIILLQRNSPVTESFNKITRKLFESGILSKWRSQYIYDTVKKNPPSSKLSLRHSKVNKYVPTYMYK